MGDPGLVIPFLLDFFYLAHIGFPITGHKNTARNSCRGRSGTREIFVGMGLDTWIDVPETIAAVVPDVFLREM
jgi:hypothetical protein